MFESLRKLIAPFTTLAVALLGLAASATAHADPPSRVARLAYESGVVSFSPAGDTQWARVALNRPLITGDRLWVDAGSRAELQVGGAAIRIGDNTSASLLNVDDRMVQMQLAQGSLSIRVWHIAPDQQIEVDTPNLAYVVRRPGRYRVDVDPNDSSTAVLVRLGEADVYGNGASFRLPAGDGYRFYDTALRDYERFAAGPPDDLERWASARDRRWEHSISARYVPRDMIGYEDLDEYGRWQQAPGYGEVWFPTRVAANWAPYRDGHWAWVDPWGWTWVDDAPWGFAPSHYGRWAYISDRWGWVPGPVAAQPVYAPALVAFIGAAVLDVALHSGPSIAWFPLAPHEVYRPPYQASPQYITRVNRTNTVVNVTNITNVYNTRNVTKVVYANQRVPGAVIAVPTTTFAQAQPVAAHAIRVRAQQIAAVAAAPVAPAPHVAPAATSLLGSHPAAAQPRAAAVLQHAVVAHTAPPAPPPPVAQRLAAVAAAAAASPGKPVPPPAPVAPHAAAAQAHAAVAAPPVKVVQAPPAAAARTAPPPVAPGARAERHQAATQAAAPLPPRTEAARAAPPAPGHPPAAAAASRAAPPPREAARAPAPAETRAAAQAARAVPPPASRPPIAGTPPVTPPVAATPPARPVDSLRAREDARRRPEPATAATARPPHQAPAEPAHAAAAPRPAPPAVAAHEPPHPPAAAAPRTRENAAVAGAGPHPPPPQPHPAPPVHAAAPAQRAEPPAAPPPHATPPPPHPEAPPPSRHAEAQPPRPASPPHAEAPAAHAPAPRPAAKPEARPSAPGRANEHRPSASEPRR